MTLDPELIDELSAFIGRLRLLDVRCVAIEANVNEYVGNPPTGVNFALNDKIDYGIDEGKFICRIGASATILSTNETLAEIRTKHVLVHSLEPGEELNPAAIESYLQNNAVFLAYPYIREVIQSTFARFGLGSMVLNILQRNIPTATLKEEVQA